MNVENAKLLNQIVRETFNGVTPEDVLRFEDGSFYVGDKLIQMSEIEAYKEEAKVILNTHLWPLLLKNVADTAIKRIAHHSNNFDDVFFGKAMLYELDVIDKMLTALSKVVIPTIPVQKKEAKIVR